MASKPNRFWQSWARRASRSASSLEEHKRHRRWNHVAISGVVEERWWSFIGGFLALLACAAGLSITRLATYETPYAVDQNATTTTPRLWPSLRNSSKAAITEAALIYFFATTGMPEAWSNSSVTHRIGRPWSPRPPTLIYELKLKTAAGNALVPVAELAEGKSAGPGHGRRRPDWMRAASGQAAHSVASGTYL